MAKKTKATTKPISRKQRQPPPTRAASYPPIKITDRYAKVMPDIGDAEKALLKASIAEKGLLYSIILDSDGAIVDGHNRWEIIQDLKKEGIEVEVKTRVQTFPNETAAKSYIRAINFARRQLTTKQKRKLIEDQLRDNPTDSNRKIAALFGVSHPTVAAVRSTGKNFQSDTRTGADGRTRKATTKRATRPRSEDEADREPQPTGRSRRPKTNGAEPADGFDEADGNGVTHEDVMYEAVRVFMVAVRAHAVETGQTTTVHIADLAKRWIDRAFDALEADDGRELDDWLDGKFVLAPTSADDDTATKH